MKKKHILLIASAIVFSACSQEAFNTEKEPVAEPFTGNVETAADVDLGLSAHWAGYNVGAASPEQYGNHYAWGETAVKEEYLESTYSYLDPGTVISEGTDVATKEMGYGFQMPSKEDVQELIDNCSVRFCSFNGVNGWVATSLVKGFEGKSIFFPAAGYVAGRNVNYQGSYAVFWTKEQVSTTNKRAVNGFFKGDSLYLNMPPKGVGGLAWCGYSVRAVRKFTLSLDETQTKVSRETTSVTAKVRGNARWTASVTGQGADVQPKSGEGSAEIKLSFGQNDTEDVKTYVLTVNSPEIKTPLIYTVTQFGITPDFKISGKQSEEIEWDKTIASCALQASPSVSWTAVVKVDGETVKGAEVIPSSGIGSAPNVQIVLPVSVNMRGETAYSVDFTTSDSRIPVELSTVSYVVYQAPTPYVPFSDTNVLMDEAFYEKLIAECGGTTSPYTLSKTVTIDNVTVAPVSSVLVDATYFIYKKCSYSFTVAQPGNADMVLYCSIYRGKKYEMIWTDKNGEAKQVPADVAAKLTNSTSSDIYYNTDAKALHLCLNGVEAGDVIKISSTGTDAKNQRMYRFYWKENK